jgi:hypothetical protein
MREGFRVQPARVFMRFEAHSADLMRVRSFWVLLPPRGDVAASHERLYPLEKSRWRLLFGADPVAR